MRVANTSNGLKVQAIAGTYVVMLGFHLIAQKLLLLSEMMAHGEAICQEACWPVLRRDGCLRPSNAMMR